jgi:hypothetical protein
VGGHLAGLRRDDVPAAGLWHVLERAADLLDQGLEALGGGGPLRLLGRQLVGRLPDLLDRGLDLVGG